MKYMVMECHLSYAVVLGEDGCFRKVANMRYEPGQMVTEIFEMEMPENTGAGKKKPRWAYYSAAAAACLMIAATAMFQAGNRTFGSIYMTINPNIRIDVNKKDLVVGLEGLNQDGEDLIRGYEYKREELDEVMDDLVDRAIDEGYLYEGGTISLTLDAKDDEWVVDHSRSLGRHLDDYLEDKISVTIEITGQEDQAHQVMIPVAPASGDDHYDEGDYGETEGLKQTVPIPPQTAPASTVPAETAPPATEPVTAAPPPTTAPPTIPAPPPTTQAPVPPSMPSGDDDTDYDDDDGQTDYGSGDDTDYDFDDD